MSEVQKDALLEKIRNLAPGKLGEVEEFVDRLYEGRDDMSGTPLPHDAGTVRAAGEARFAEIAATLGKQHPPEWAVAIEPRSGEHAVGATETEAVDFLRAHWPDRLLYVRHVGEHQHRLRVRGTPTSSGSAL